MWPLTSVGYGHSQGSLESGEEFRTINPCYSNIEVSSNTSDAYRYSNNNSSSNNYQVVVVVVVVAGVLAATTAKAPAATTTTTSKETTATTTAAATTTITSKETTATTINCSCCCSSRCCFSCNHSYSNKNLLQQQLNFNADSTLKKFLHLKQFLP